MTLWDGTRWVPDDSAPAAAPRSRRFLGAAAEALLIVTLIFGLIASTALAAPPAGKGGGKDGGGKNSGTISLVLLDGTDAVANYMERAAFDVSTTATDRPFVGLRCWQTGGMVLDGYTGYFDEYMFDPWVTLGSPYWDPAASADCTARLFYYDKRGNEKVLATIDFPTEP